MSGRPMGWGGILRLGVVQASIGAVLVLITSTLNRVMVVELRLAASVPGALVALHYALQMLRPRWGHGADRAMRRTPWIAGGMVVLGLGGTLAAAATALMASWFAAGLALAILAFALIGIGAGAAGTALLTLLADTVGEGRRPAAAALVWITMIVGFIVTSVAASVLLQPFSLARLVWFSGGVCAVAVLASIAALWGLERGLPRSAPTPQAPFRRALAMVWSDRDARWFTLFIVVAMLAYSAQDLILEPFAGLAFGLPPASTTGLTAVQNGGVLVGMLAVAAYGRLARGRSVATGLTLAGCLLSALALAAIALTGALNLAAALRPAIAALGFANGVFAAAAVALMMARAQAGGGVGVRMGVWGAAQAIATGAGGFLGTVAVDTAHAVLGRTMLAYAVVFGCEATLFVAASVMVGTRAGATQRRAERRPSLAIG